MPDYSLICNRLSSIPITFQKEISLGPVQNPCFTWAESNMQMRMILQNFEQFPKGLDWKYYCYGFKAAIVQINLMILGRSASKRLSEPGRYKVHSYNLFMRKFWILSLLNAHRSYRNVCFKYIKKSKFRVVCSPSFKLDRIDQDIFLLYPYGMSLVL